jgi:hypothetical protein
MQDTDSSLPAGFAQRVLDPDIPLPRGRAQFSLDGTVFRARVVDQAGRAVGAFAAPVTLAIKYTPADLAAANGVAAALAPAYLIEEDTPAIVNPDHFSPGSWVFFPPSAVSVDSANGVLRVQTQALGAAIAVFGRPAPVVRTRAGNTWLYSGFDPVTSLIFGARSQQTRLEVVEPQIGDRLLVRDPANGSYAYVDANEVEPAETG